MAENGHWKLGRGIFCHLPPTPHPIHRIQGSYNSKYSSRLRCNCKWWIKIKIRCKSWKLQIESVVEGCGASLQLIWGVGAFFQMKQKQKKTVLKATLTKVWSEGCQSWAEVIGRRRQPAGWEHRSLHCNTSPPHNTDPPLKHWSFVANGSDKWISKYIHTKKSIQISIQIKRKFTNIRHTQSMISIRTNIQIYNDTNQYPNIFV